MIRHGIAGLLLAAAVWGSGCQGPGPQPTPSGREARLQLVGLSEQVVVNGAGGSTTRTPMAHIALVNPAPSAVRVLEFEGDIRRGRTLHATVHWKGNDTFPAGARNVYNVPIRPQTVSAAQAAIDAAQPPRLARYRLAYDDANGVRHIASYP